MINDQEIRRGCLQFQSEAELLLYGLKERATRMLQFLRPAANTRNGLSSPKLKE